MSLNLRQGVTFTNLGRAFHPIYDHHKRVLWLMTTATIVASIAAFLRAEALFAILAAGINGALAGFIAWALAREFDPDRERISPLAIIWITLTAIFFGTLPLLPSMVFIGMARYLNRIIGLPLRRFEALAILLLPLALMFYFQNLVFGLLAVLTFSLEAYHEKFPRKETRYAVLAFIATIGFVFFDGVPTFTLPSMFLSAIAAIITLLMLIKLLRMKQPQTRTDFNDLPINLPRLRTSVLLSLLIAILALHTGDSGFLLLAPLWAALLTAAI